MIWSLALQGLNGVWGSYIKIGLLTAAVSTLGYFVYQYDSRGRQITAYKFVVSERDNRIKVLEANVDLGKGVIDALNNRLGQALDGLKDACTMLTEIEKSKAPGADEPAGEPISGVLEKLK